MMLQDEIEFKRITINEKLDRFCELMQVCFNLNIEPNYFEWKYFKNPAGNLIAYEAVHNNKTIAFYGVIPEWYNINGKNYTVYQSMDTMTHPDYQKKGLFTKLAKYTYDEIQRLDNGYYLIGFPGGESYYGFEKKLFWKTVYKASYIFTNKILFKTLNIIKKKHTVSFIELKYNDERIKDYFKKENNNNKNFIFKTITPEIIDWKILKNPIRKYTVVGIFEETNIVGILIYQLDAEKTCQITWLNFLQQQNYLKYCSLLINYLFNTTNKRYIYSWTPTDPILLKAYKKSGLIKNPFKKGPFTQTFPLITKHEGNNPAGIKWEEIKEFDFQPIMLD